MRRFYCRGPREADGRPASSGRSSHGVTRPRRGGRPGTRSTSWVSCGVSQLLERGLRIGRVRTGHTHRHPRYARWWLRAHRVQLLTGQPQALGLRGTAP